ncbi:MAG: histidinol-phosphate transaminase [Cyanobacteria bacterium J007]|jgi:histidinol-phosphate aminotransferase|nr:MAG: histidinol-phosphate transaminase [Cyanobacteria bacterium J007]
MLSFIRSDLSDLKAYTPHPETAMEGVSATPIRRDRLDTNESPYDLPAELKQKLGWTYEQLIETNRYPDGTHQGLREAIAEYVNESAGSNAGAIAPSQLSVGNGSDELIRSILIATCLNGQGSILVADPTFSMYAILAQTLGIEAIAVGRHEENFAIDVDAAQQALETQKNPPIRVIFVVHPNSPTANALTPAEIDWLRAIPDNILVVVDEAYFEFSQTTLVGELNRHPNWAILRTFSKAFRLAAMRVGYAIAHPDLIAALEKIRLPYNLPSFSQAAAELAMQQRSHLLASIPETLAERDRLYQALSNLSGLTVWPSSANFIYLRGDRQTPPDLARLAAELKTRGTLVRYTCNGLRVTVGTPSENQRTLENFQRLLGASS